MSDATLTPTRRRRASRTTRVVAVIIGAALAGGAAYAALTWYQSRGTGSTNVSIYDLTLTAATSGDATAAGPDALLDGSTLTPGIGQTLVTLTDGSLGTFTVGTYNGVPGYVAPVALTYAAQASGIPMSLQSVKVVQTGTDLPFPAGTAPVVAYMATGCGTGIDSDPGSPTPGSTTVGLRLVTTDAAPDNTGTPAPFDVVVEWVPTSLYAAGVCQSTPPATPAAP